MYKIIIIALFAVIYNLDAGIVINEIMPMPFDDEPEWIELYNNSAEAVAFDTLYIQDMTTAKPFIAITLQSNQYAVLTRDTTLLRQKREIPEETQVIYAKLPGLNNDADYITLRDAQFNTLDSFAYINKPVYKGVSFERVNANMPVAEGLNVALSMSVDSATCGYLNSCSLADNGSFVTDRKDDLEIIVSENPFRKGVHKDCVVSFGGCYQNGIFMMDILDLDGRIVATIDGINEMESLNQVNIVEKLQRLPIGAYLIRVQAKDSDGNAEIQKIKLIAVGD